MSGAPPPGWYPDPWHAAPTRWWDGEQWTAEIGEHGIGVVAAPALGAGASASATRPDVVVVAADASAAVQREVAVARWVRWAVLVPPLLALVSLSATARTLRTALDSVEGTDGAGSVTAADEASLGSQLAGLVTLAAMVGQMLWTYRAVCSGRLLGQSGRRSPALASAGWIIPVVNYWWPYQDVRGLFPVGQRPTRQLRWWWFLHVLTFPLLAVAVAGLVAAGHLALWAPLAVLPPVGAAVLLRELIDRAVALHRQRASGLGAALGLDVPGRTI